MDNNIFTVTRLGQLRNIKGFINQYNAKNNILVILYTTQNLEIVENISQNIEEGDFEEVVYLELPRKPLRVMLKKVKDIHSRILYTYLELHEQYKYEHIFLANLDNFYKYFEQVAEHTGSELMLIEEGLTTYRMFAKNMKRTFTFRDVKSQFKSVLKAIRSLILKSIVLVLKILSWILKVNLVDFFKHIRIPKKYRYGYIDHFKEAYVCFPDKMKKMTSEEDIGKIKKLDFYLDKELDKGLVEKLDDDMVLYINQQYVPYHKHFNIIFDILEREGIDKITFKFHPKEKPQSYMGPLEDAKVLHPNLEVKVLEGFDHIPVENLLTTGKVKKVVGLTTSSLIYTTLINPDVEVLSLAKSYMDLCLSKKYDVDARRMELYKRDYQAFDKVFDVKQI